MKTKTQSLSDLYRQDPRKACQLALRRTAHIASKDRIDAINGLLGGHGTEAIRGEWQNGFWCDIVAVYVNMGDTYSITVVQVRGDWGDQSRFIISSWGDWVERHGEKMGVM